ncbi:MAG: hypothetical protein HUJ18_07860 [Marinobacter sp.]|nr:hypothetical protein [Marinobacter sp.]
MKIFVSRKLGSLLLVAVGMLFLNGCSDSDGIASPGDADSDDDVVLPSLTTQIEHWEQTGVFLAAADCGLCHTASEIGADPAAMRTPEAGGSIPSPTGGDISPFYDWKSSVMANAFTDPYFRANMMHETEVFPHLAGFIEDTCLTCHTPMARTHAHQTGASLLVQDDSCGLEDGCYRADQAMEDPHAREGISCTACHQILPNGTTNPEDFVHSGNYQISSDTANLQIFGPYENPQGQAMQNWSGYEPVFSEHIEDPRHCASCHELFTPTIDMETAMPNGEQFPEQTPYTEWLYSEWGPDGRNTSCQQCHMARPELAESYQTRIALTASGVVNTSWEERTPYFPHVMVGGNTWLLETLELFREEFGREAINEEGEFAGTAEMTREFLKTSADLLPTNQSISGSEILFDLTIRNNTGHKLPTSFPSRRIWLATRVTDSNGVTVFESGFPDSNGHLVTDAVYTSDECMSIEKPADFDSDACYQGHVTAVADEADIPVYEVVMGSTTGAITHVLLYAAESLKDNRIPPVGFDSAAVPEAVRPQGVEGDADFNEGNSGTDTVSYRLALPEGVAPPFQVESTLFYQTIRPTFVAAVHGEHPWIQEFESVVSLNPPRAEVLASVSFLVE